jgi:glucose-6-phosphate isomerase
MQLPDEAITYHYTGALNSQGEEWSPAAELRTQNLLPPNKLREIAPRIMQVRSQVATERELSSPPADLQPLHAGFIDLPQKLLDQHRRVGESSTLGRILKIAGRLREEVDRVVVLGIGGSHMGARALFEALRSAYHNDLPARDRPGCPRIFFEGNSADNDSLSDLLQMLQITCVDPDLREERWGAIVISKSGGTLETAVAYRAVRRELAEYYGNHSPKTKNLVIPITGETGKLRALCRADGYPDENVLTVPDDVGGRFSVFSPVGLLPAAAMNLDVRALLLGAAAMTRRFLDEPFDRNPVLQYAAVNYLLYTECKKPIRVLSVWSKKLEALGLWYDQLLSESLGKHGVGATPLTTVQTRDLHSRGQQHQDGARDKFINNLVVKASAHPPIMIGMQDHNQDELNQFNRKGLPDILNAALRGTNQAYFEAARPTADLTLPVLSEHVMGQLMQMLMLATVVEGRLLGINPYGQPGVEAYKRHMQAILRAQPNPT